MAHNNNNKKRKAPNNPDPMSNTRTMGREGMKIIHNIAFGTYNIFNDGHVFRNLTFVNATIEEVDKRLKDAAIHLQAMQYAYGQSTDPTVKNLLLRDQKTFEAYTLIRDVLSRIAISGGDTGFLYVLASNLPKYKYNI